MIGCFLDPYDHELIYSLCARIQQRMQFPSLKRALHGLFGPSCSTVTIDLPCHLGNFTAKLPPGHRYTDDILIDRYTLLPFFSPFIPNERVSYIRENMKRGNGLAVHKKSGILASRIPNPVWLRFCPVCSEEDRKQLRETYWHRLHQIPGVEVCHLHHIFLEASKVRRDSSREILLFAPAEDAVQIPPARSLDDSDRNHHILFKIALDAAWLLEHPSLGADLKALHNRYIKLLIDRRLATYTGSIHVNQLLNEFREFYQPSLLRLLNCEFTCPDQLKTNWLLRLVRPPKHAQHPLYHLLLMQFLGHTAEEFFQLPKELNIFGEGPWPCLNPAAEHFREPMIQECRLATRLRNNNPTGKFTCSCGFAYARTGPDSSPEDKFRIGKMISFGPLWEAKLRKLWDDPSLSLSEIGRQLRVDPLTIRRHAERLKLPFPRSSRNSTPLPLAATLKSKVKSTQKRNKLRAYRAKWLSALKLTPKLTLKAMRQKLPRVYAWLLENDSEWLKKHLPQPKKQYRSTHSVDWKKRDVEYARAVEASAIRLKKALGRPVRITKTAISRSVGAVTLLQQKLYKMPLTAQILYRSVETREQYAIRRIWWVADLYCQENVLPQEWQLVTRANAYVFRSAPAIRKVIMDAMQLIALKLSQEQMLRAVG